MSYSSVINTVQYSDCSIEIQSLKVTFISSICKVRYCTNRGHRTNDERIPPCLLNQEQMPTF